jgi:hypothetical protein
MGLLMSDSLMPDPLLDEALRLLDGLSELAYAADATCAGHEHEAADLSEWPRPTRRSVALATDTDP